ncbi:MAG: hypothetical protein ABFR75_00850 [Acidobacteriota bacterium]
MKKLVIIVIFVLIFTFMVFNQDVKQEVKQEVKTVPETKETEVKKEDISLGRIYFPRAFVHEGKDFKRGIYKVVLTEKDGIPYFNVLDKKNVFLFEDLAIVKKNKSRFKKFRYRVRKELLRGYEYFRIKVTKPDNLYFGYFLLKKKETKKVVKDESEKSS